MTLYFYSASDAIFPWLLLLLFLTYPAGGRYYRHTKSCCQSNNNKVHFYIYLQPIFSRNRCVYSTITTSLLSLVYGQQLQGFWIQKFGKSVDWPLITVPYLQRLQDVVHRRDVRNKKKIPNCAESACGNEANESIGVVSRRCVPATHTAQHGDLPHCQCHV